MKIQTIIEIIDKKINKIKYYNEKNKKEIILKDNINLFLQKLENNEFDEELLNSFFEYINFNKNVVELSKYFELSKSLKDNILFKEEYEKSKTIINNLKSAIKNYLFKLTRNSFKTKIIIEENENNIKELEILKDCLNNNKILTKEQVNNINEILKESDLETNKILELIIELNKKQAQIIIKTTNELLKQQKTKQIKRTTMKMIKKDSKKTVLTKKTHTDDEKNLLELKIKIKNDYDEITTYMKIAYDILYNNEKTIDEDLYIKLFHIHTELNEYVEIFKSDDNLDYNELLELYNDYLLIKEEFLIIIENIQKNNETDYDYNEESNSAENFYGNNPKNIFIFLDDIENEQPYVITDIENDENLKKEPTQSLLKQLKLYVNNNFPDGDHKIKTDEYSEEWLKKYKTKTNHSGVRRIGYSIFCSNIGKVMPEFSNNTHITIIYAYQYGASDKEKKNKMHKTILKRIYKNQQEIDYIINLFNTDWKGLNEKEIEDKKREINHYISENYTKLEKLITLSKNSKGELNGKTNKIN